MKEGERKLEQLFNYCNNKYFDGELPLPKLKVSHAKTRLGSMSCKRTIRKEKGLIGWMNGGRKAIHAAFTDFQISISDYYMMTDDQREDVMIHEMIHYSIAYTGLRDTAPHGVVFRGMMDAINRKFGRHISVMTTTKGWQPRISPKPTKFLVLGLHMRSGEYFLSSVNRSFAGRLELQISRLRDVESHRWVETTDEYFRNFPCVRSLRGRRVTKAVFESKLGIRAANP